jgi:hypothetical protein
LRLRIFRLIVLVPLAGLACLLPVFALAWSQREAGDSVLSEIAGVHPARDMRLAMARRFAGTRADDPGVTAQLSEALRRGPLEEEPFVLAALDAYSAKDYARAARLLETARRRNPRSSEAHLLSVDVALAEGRIGDAVASLEVLLRLAPSRTQLIRETLVLISGHPETGKAALAALKDERTKIDVLAALARGGKSAAEIADAIATARASGALAASHTTINSVVRPLIDGGDAAGAYSVWSSLVPQTEGPGSLVRDTRFQDALPPPFGWELVSSRAGYVTTEPAGLIGEAYGREATPLARQLVLLPGGAYRLRVDVAEAGELFEVVVQCVRREELVRVRLDQTGLVSAPFDVPADCPAQWLEVRARASDPPQAASLHIKAITIGRDGS